MVSASVEKRADVIICCVMHVNMFIACILCFVLVQNFPLIDSVGLVSVSPVTHARHVTRSFVAWCQCVPQEFTPQPQTISPTSPEDGGVVSSNVSESDSLDRLVLFKEGLSACSGQTFFNVYLALAVPYCQISSKQDTDNIEPYMVVTFLVSLDKNKHCRVTVVLSVKQFTSSSSDQ